MNGRLVGGVQCCLTGCENEAGTRKFDSMIGQYEIKCSPHDLKVISKIVRISGYAINIM